MTDVKPSPVFQEILDERAAQAGRVLAVVGPLLDAWDALPNDVRRDPELKDFAIWVGRLDSAMEGNLSEDDTGEWAAVELANMLVPEGFRLHEDPKFGQILVRVKQ